MLEVEAERSRPRPRPRQNLWCPGYGWRLKCWPRSFNIFVYAVARCLYVCPSVTTTQAVDLSRCPVSTHQHTHNPCCWILKFLVKFRRDDPNGAKRMYIKLAISDQVTITAKYKGRFTIKGK